MFKIFGKRDIEGLDRSIDNIWKNINTLYEGKRQINNLFAKDRHGTVRPKVDMLSDIVEKVNKNMWIECNKLNERIEKLEKK